LLICFHKLFLPALEEDFEDLDNKLVVGADTMDIL
jgi:hypothetical protein